MHKIIWITSKLWIRCSCEAFVLLMSQQRSWSFCFCGWWIYLSFALKFKSFEMKLEVSKFKFYSPPLLSLLHHLATFCEFENMMILWQNRKLMLVETWMTLWIVKLSAKLISIGGMRDEKIHIKCPIWPYQMHQPIMSWRFPNSMRYLGKTTKCVLLDQEKRWIS